MVSQEEFKSQRSFEEGSCRLPHSVVERPRSTNNVNEAEITYSTQFLGHSLAIFLAHRCHLLLLQFLTYRGIVSQIGLCADDETWNTGTVMMNLRKPFLADVFE